MTRFYAQGLTFSYADRLILDSISLEFCAGEILVLLGANGAGKTTLLQSLSRQLNPVNGVVGVDGRDIQTMSRRSLAQSIAFMPQQENRGTPLRVIDVVRLGRTPHRGWWMPLTRDDSDIVDQSLEAAGLTDLRDRVITELSGGEWRRMILARALAQASPIVLLDEPTAGLDLKFQFDVLDRVRQMAKQRGLIVVVTLHDLNHAALFGDRLALLSQRSILALGSPQEVLQPHLIEQAFGVSVVVIEHPVHGTPFVVPLGESCTSETQQRHGKGVPRE
ncbi:ABC transporter ATP-binding protein [Novipirellula rosea]|uniref:ABC transporter ATP-binding protein n=1 Tax=Novipirellula rosea TaxID=1031540 RepID=A0ABP8NUI7_9BACT